MTRSPARPSPAGLSWPRSWRKVKRLHLAQSRENVTPAIGTNADADRDMDGHGGARFLTNRGRYLGFFCNFQLIALFVS